MSESKEQMSRQQKVQAMLSEVEKALSALNTFLAEDCTATSTDIEKLRVPTKCTTELSCPRCHGTGKLTNTSDQEHWNFWIDLCLKLEQALSSGAMSPTDCSVCGGSGEITEDSPVSVKVLEEQVKEKECATHGDGGFWEEFADCPACKKRVKVLEMGGNWSCAICGATIFSKEGGHGKAEGL